MVDLTPYSTVRPLMGPLETWLSGDDAQRLQAYTVYESIYRNVPEAFKLVQRGDEQNPIYIPSARTIIEAKNRYLAKRWNYALQPKVGTDGDRVALGAMMQQLFIREQMYAKFATQKRWGMVRGDAVWHIRADLNKEPGSRVSVDEVDPASYFPIEDPWNSDKILGVHLVDPVLAESGKTVIKRQTYRKEDNGRISYELSWWQTGAWDDRQEGVDLKKADSVDIPDGDDNKPVLYELDPRITSIPVYHVKNNRITGYSFGNSEISGIETLIAGVNQAISDEDLALAMQGLGLYWTNSGPPVDENDEETNWKFGPGWVLEIDTDATFGRVQGISSVEPSLAHIAKLESSMREGSGVPDIAIGSNVDVQTVESGIALAFKMSPILAGNEEKEGEILSVMDHLLYDLTTMWFPVFEQLDSPARAVSTVDDPLPVNREKTLQEIILMLTNSVISVAYAQQLISDKLGYDFPDEMLSDIVDEQTALALARNVDPFQSRVVDEIDDTGAGA